MVRKMSNLPDVPSFSGRERGLCRRGSFALSRSSAAAAKKEPATAAASQEPTGSRRMVSPVLLVYEPNGRMSCQLELIKRDGREGLGGIERQYNTCSSCPHGVLVCRLISGPS